MYCWENGVCSHLSLRSLISFLCWGYPAPQDQRILLPGLRWCANRLECGPQPEARRCDSRLDEPKGPPALFRWYSQGITNGKPPHGRSADNSNSTILTYPHCQSYQSATLRSDLLALKLCVEADPKYAQLDNGIRTLNPLIVCIAMPSEVHPGRIICVQ